MSLQAVTVLRASPLLRLVGATAPHAAPSWIAAIVLALLAISISDLHTRRVPNGLVLTTLALSVVSWMLAAGIWGVGDSLLGLVLAFCGLIGAYALGMVGGADVKVLAAYGALVGPQALIAMACASAFFAGLMGLVTLYRPEHGLHGVLLACLRPGRALERARISRTTLPLTVAFTGGVLTVLFGGRA